MSGDNHDAKYGGRGLHIISWEKPGINYITVFSLEKELYMLYYF